MRRINEMSNREALGLPIFYKASRIEDNHEIFRQFLTKSIADLIDIIASSPVLAERWVAATILGLMGDPRIEPLNPTMITIPSAKITIGSTLEEIELLYQTYESIGVEKKWLLKEYPKHEVYITKFNIGKFPVTNYEYLQFIKATDYPYLPSSWNLGIYDPIKSNHPVYGVMPENADDYAFWLSKKTNRHFRLPTEYEWEYAAAGVKGNEFPWGQDFCKDYANTIESEIYMTTPIGIYPKGESPFGCLDMAGNVEEYTSTEYFPYPNGWRIHDDLNRINNYRITRGGSFTRYSDLARCKRRHGFYNKDIYIFGFRLAETVIEE